MRTYVFRWCVSLALLTCMLLALSISLDRAKAASPHPVRHSTPQVTLNIRFGRIFFTPNRVSCSRTAKPCFILTYVSNDGPRPVWLDQTQEYILQTGQHWPFTFATPGIHKFTLFQHSTWWKILVTVS